MTTKSEIAKISVKYPKGLFKLAQILKLNLERVHPNCQIIFHKLTDKRGVHSSVVSVYIICKPVVFNKFYKQSNILMKRHKKVSINLKKK